MTKSEAIALLKFEGTYPSSLEEFETIRSRELLCQQELVDRLEEALSPLIEPAQ